jgi:hypothetical protein
MDRETWHALETIGCITVSAAQIAPGHANKEMATARVYAFSLE